MSDAIAIRDGALARLKTAAAFQANPLRIARFRKSPLRQIQPTDLPCLSVYFLSERGSSDSETNQGIPSFLQEGTIGIAVAAAISDDDDREDALDLAFETAITTLLEDGSFVAMFEGISGFERSNVEGVAGAQAETPYAEMRLKLSVTYRRTFEPLATTPLNQVNVTAQPNGDPNAAPITAEFNLG